MQTKKQRYSNLQYQLYIRYYQIDQTFQQQKLSLSSILYFIFSSKMLKKQVEQLLSINKVSSISDIIYFVIEQVNKSLQNNPMDQIYLRLQELEKPKGLDIIMIEQVKTITEAMLDQRQENIRFDFDKALNDHIDNMQNLIESINYSDQNKKQRQSLAELDIVNLMNTLSSTSLQTSQQSRKFRQSYKQNFTQNNNRDNLMNDYHKAIERISNNKKQIDDLKYSILQINKSISNKITLTQTQNIIEAFQSRIYKNLQRDKLQMQKIQFNIKKQLQQEIFKIRKQTFAQINKEQFNSQSANFQKNIQKLQKKLFKYIQQIKNISKTIKNLSKQQINLYQHIELTNNKFNQYTTFNDQKNQDLKLILEDINQKLSYFQKIDQIQQKINTVSQNILKSCFLTQSKTKNDLVIWQKQIINTNQNIFKYQKEKSQIFIIQPALYQVQFTFLQNKQSLLTGSLFVNSDFTKKQIKLVGNSQLSSLIQINQKSWISLKLNQSNLGGKAIIKISKY